MRAAVVVIALAACSGGRARSDDCAPACGVDQTCRYGTCVAPPAGCMTAACAGDTYCDTSAMECLPWGVGPGGEADVACHDDPAPGVFFPVEQCAWNGPRADDPFPAHRNVLATPMVARLGGAPAIVVASYNGSDRGGAACIGNDPDSFGVLRVLDGATCALTATLGAPTVIASAPVALGDLDGDGAPEIVAARSAGGLVAFTHGAGGWTVLWQTASTLADDSCDWTGPAIHDLDDDGHPEVIFYGAVYDGRTGAARDETIGPGRDSSGNGYIPVVADVDNDGLPELVTGLELYRWTAGHWQPARTLPGSFDHVAVGDFGTYPAAGQDDRTRRDGIAEVALVTGGVVQVINIHGREVFRASLGGDAGPGGPPVLADFDGDGRLEIGVAAQDAYRVLDPDCQGAAEAATCAARTRTGVLWSQPARDAGPSFAASSAFDFDGDGRAEVVRSDECFTRIADGSTGEVLGARARTSCLFYDNAIVADVDGDAHAELVTTSNASCGVTCPALDPLFDGVACLDDGDCAGMRCARERRDDARGRCRCTASTDCGDGYACADPVAGPSPAGKVCRAAHATGALAGVHVLADAADRWGSARPIWNQHAYAVTNVDAAGQVPRTSAWQRSWVGLNSFRQNAPADGVPPHARPDLTVKQAKVTCEATVPTVTAEVCNRGALLAGAGVPVAVYAATTPSKLRCAAATTAPLAPGACTVVSCAWDGPAGDGAVVVDDRGNGTGATRECREDNNAFALAVSCPEVR